MNPDPHELEAADQLAQHLESNSQPWPAKTNGSPVLQASGQKNSDRQLSDLVRESSKIDLPASSDSLRAAMLRRIESDAPNELASSIASRGRGMWLTAVVAATALIAVAIWYGNQTENGADRTALGNATGSLDLLRDASSDRDEEGEVEGDGKGQLASEKPADGTDFKIVHDQPVQPFSLNPGPKGEANGPGDSSPSRIAGIQPIDANPGTMPSTGELGFLDRVVVQPNANQKEESAKASSETALSFPDPEEWRNKRVRRTKYAELPRKGWQSSDAADSQLGGIEVSAKGILTGGNKFPGGNGVDFGDERGDLYGFSGQNAGQSGGARPRSQMGEMMAAMQALGGAKVTRGGDVGGAELRFEVENGRGLVEGKIPPRYQPLLREYHKRLDPDESAEQYERLPENQFMTAKGETAISTFSVDVDSASYANVRRFLRAGQLPPTAAVRIEEMVNYFKYDYPQPKDGNPFSVNMELANCPWDASHKLLRVGLKGKEVHREERPATNLVLLIDVSGSMSDANKLPLLKQGFDMMVGKLTENDKVSIVTYAGNAGVALETTSGDQAQKIRDAIEQLNSGGSTHGSEGIKLAYELAQRHFIEDGVNKVVLATDGDLNVGITQDDELVKLIKQKSSEGVFLTVLGFGTGNLKDAKMEKLADNGNGMYAYIDSVREAHRVLVDQMSASLVTIAKDVKLQLEFNPAEVSSYRLIGYENRSLKTEDFDNDRVDAGEIGAGHTVTAIYELVTTDNANVVDVKPGKPFKLKYQQSAPAKPAPVQEEETALNAAANSGELLTLSLRYKQPDSNESELVEMVIKNDEKSFDSASEDFRFAASVAAFGMRARRSEFCGKADIRMIRKMAVGAMDFDPSGYRAEFLELLQKFEALEARYK